MEQPGTGNPRQVIRPGQLWRRVKRILKNAASVRSCYAAL